MRSFIEVFFTHSHTFGKQVHPARIEGILSDYPIAPVLRLFSRILHAVEQGGDRLETERAILMRLADPETIRRVEAEVDRLERRGSSARIFTELTLLNFLKLALRHCPVGDRNISPVDVDLLFRCYLATHDHFPPGRSTRPSGSTKAFAKWLEPDLVRQSLRLDEPMDLLLPRYWALWVALPSLLGKREMLESFLPPSAPTDTRRGFVVGLSLWAYWTSKAKDLSAPVMLRKQYWDGHPQVGSDIGAWLDEIALPAAVFKRELENEWLRLGRDAVWDYSFVTMQNWPLIWVGEDLYCPSLKGLIRRVTDGVYYRMLTACAGDQERVNNLTSLFGEFFHAYVHDIWQRIAGRESVRKIIYAEDQKEAGDGLVERGSDLLIYDAKSTRFRLPTTRTGRPTDLTNDLQRGILKAAQQLDGAIKDIKAGLVTSASQSSYVNYYPIVVTATPFPGIPAPYRLMDSALKEQGLLTSPDIAPLQVVDAEGLEILEGAMSVGVNPLGLLVERARKPQWRILGIKNLLFTTRGEAPRNQRMRSTILALLGAVEEWLNTGRLEEDTITRTLFPALISTTQGE